jgi:nucleotide-binding universal stress UspA family protein
MTGPKRILVPLDFSEPSIRALVYAKMLGQALTASFDLLHVVPNPYTADPAGLYTPLPQNFLDDFEREARTRLEEALTPEERKAFKTRYIVNVGDPLFEIVEYARLTPVDLIVMGTHGRTGMSHLFLGSVAERVVRTAPCPVLTVR